MWQLICIVFFQSDVDTIKVDDDEGKEVSIQVSVEMPFDIRSIECPTHQVKIKVSFSGNHVKIETLFARFVDIEEVMKVQCNFIPQF